MTMKRVPALYMLLALLTLLLAVPTGSALAGQGVQLFRGRILSVEEDGALLCLWENGDFRQEFTVQISEETRVEMSEAPAPGQIIDALAESHIYEDNIIPADALYDALYSGVVGEVDADAGRASIGGMEFSAWLTLPEGTDVASLQGATILFVPDPIEEGGSLSELKTAAVTVCESIFGRVLAREYDHMVVDMDGTPWRVEISEDTRIYLPTDPDQYATVFFVPGGTPESCEPLIIWGSNG